MCIASDFLRAIWEPFSHIYFYFLLVAIKYDLVGYPGCDWPDKQSLLFLQDKLPVL